MCKSYLWVVGTALLVLSSAAVAGPVIATHSVELEDPVGDVLSDGEEPGKDVVGIGIASDGTELLFTVTLDRKIAEYLAGNKAGDVIQVNVDVDSDLSTGGKTFWGGKEGFEYKLSIRSCIRYEGGGEVCVGGMSSAEEGYFSSYKVETFVPGKTDTKDVHDIFWKSPRADIEGKEVVVRIPYGEIGVSSGDTIRMAIREADSTYDAESFFPEVVLTLK